MNISLFESGDFRAKCLQLKGERILQTFFSRGAKVQMCFEQWVGKKCCCFPGLSSDPFVLKVVTAVQIGVSLLVNSLYIPKYLILIKSHHSFTGDAGEMRFLQSI